MASKKGMAERHCVQRRWSASQLHGMAGGGGSSEQAGGCGRAGGWGDSRGCARMHRTTEVAAQGSSMQSIASLTAGSVGRRRARSAWLPHPLPSLAGRAADTVMRRVSSCRARQQCSRAAPTVLTTPTHPHLSVCALVRPWLQSGGRGRGSSGASRQRLAAAGGGCRILPGTARPAQRAWFASPG